MRHQSLRGRILVLVDVITPSVSLYFAYLPKSIREHVVIVDVASGLSPLRVAEASAVVWVRHTFGAVARYVAMARRMGVPQYFFVDDNFRIMRDEFEAGRLSRDAYVSLDRENLATFDGVLVSSLPMVSYFVDNALHDNVIFFPPCVSGVTVVPSNPAPHLARDTIVVGFAGGQHRWLSLRDTVIPTLRRLSEQYAISLKLVVHVSNPEQLDDSESGPYFSIVPVDYSADFSVMVSRLGNERPVAMIHSPAVPSENLPYKTLHPLLVSGLLGCVSVFPNEPPYDAEGVSSAAFIVPELREANSWARTLETALFDTAQRSKISRANRQYWKRHLSGKENVLALEAILRRVGTQMPSRTIAQRMARFYFAR